MIAFAVLTLIFFYGFKRLFMTFEPNGRATPYAAASLATMFSNRRFLWGALVGLICIIGLGSLLIVPMYGSMVSDEQLAKAKERFNHP